MLQHTYRQTFAETTGTDEEKLIHIFYYGNKAGFVYIITIVAANHGEVHHAVRDGFLLGAIYSSITGALF